MDHDLAHGTAATRGVDPVEGTARADAMAGTAYVDGAYVPIADARIPLTDWGFLRGDANQDTITVWQGRFFRLDDHLARFARNVAKLRMQLPLDDAGIRAVAFELVRRSGLREAYVQLIATRGLVPHGVRDPRLASNRFYAFCVPYVWIATREHQARGLHVVISDIRRVPAESVDPTIKHYHWLDFQMGLFDAYERGGETVLLRDMAGNVAEGPGFNVFAVTAGHLLTPASNVLDGMTRRTVIELARDEHIPCELTDISPQDLRAADEVFLSTSAGAILPVTRIDGQQVGNGEPGPLTRHLGTRYWQRREQGWHGTEVDYATA